MPRVTPFRILLLVFCGWLALIAAWAALPSPEIHRADRNDYVQRRIKSGRTLTTVIAIEDYIDADDSATFSQTASPVSALAFDWQLRSDVKSNSLSLVIGQAQINLTDALLQPKPYLSDTVTSHARTGDDHGIYLIWFTFADIILLDYELHGMDNDVGLRILSTKPGEVQIWKNSEEWNSLAMFSDNILSKDLDHLADEDHTDYLLATISGILTDKDRLDLSNLTITGLQGQLPSKTYSIRRMVQAILAPTLIVAYAITTTVIIPIILAIFYLLFIYMQILAAYLMVLFICWLYYGRPNAVTWGRQFWLSRWLFHYFDPRKPTTNVWGAAGPIVADEGELLSGERQPRPLQNPLDFFRSPSPLDDLLCTFSFTQWMLKPLSKNNGTTSQDRTLEAGRIVITTEEKLRSKG